MDAFKLIVTFYWSIVGAAVGSFLNAAADRLVKRESLLLPASHCDVCQHPLGALDLIPVVSYIALRGRCRYCGARIGARSLWVELGTALLFALAAWQIAPQTAGTLLELGLVSALLGILMLVTVTDLEHGLILDRVIWPGLALALVYTLTRGWPAMGSYILGGLAGAGLILLIRAVVPEGMGEGDVKLTAFIGLSCGLRGLGFALFIGFVVGGIIAAGLLATGRKKRGDTLPLGPFLALGGAVALLYTPQLLLLFDRLSLWLWVWSQG